MAGNKTNIQRPLKSAVNILVVYTINLWKF